MKNRDKFHNLGRLSGVLLLMLLASCSKPAPKEEAKASPSPSPVIDQSKLPPMTGKINPSSASVPITPTREEVDAYAAALGVDAATANGILQEEMAFASKLSEALDEADVAALSNLTRPHLERLRKSFETTNAYPPDPNGNVPPWFYEQLIRKGPESVGIKMNQVGYLGLDAAHLGDQRIAFSAVSRITQGKPNLIADVLTSRLDAPPSPVDTISYEALLAGFAERTATDGRTGTNDPDEDLLGSDAVKQMARAKNPIYRLIAIEQASRINTSDRLSLYESFVTEKDPRITRAAIEGLAQMQSNKTIELLRRFEQASIQAGQKDNADLAAKAITNQP